MSDATKATLQFVGAGVLSIILLAAGLYVLLWDSSAGEGLEKAATGWIGLIIGYWFK